MSATSPFEGIQIPRDLVCEFFAVFSRFEFALKESGFESSSRFGVAPDWDSFAIAIGARLHVEEESALAGAITYLTSEPPLVQVSARKWVVRKLQGGTAIGRTLNAIRRVRNNLFHGGKHTPHSPPGRDQELLRRSLVVLQACLSNDEVLHEAYEQPQR